MFSAIYRYRGFIIDSVKRDFQSRYQTSFLGAAWLILQPIAIISVYTLIFSELMRARLAGMDGPFAYSIYLCSGVLTWGLFTEMLNSLVNVFLTNANILKKLREGANKRGNSSRLTQSFHFFMFEPIFSPVNALNQPI